MDRALLARQEGKLDVSVAFVRAAEGVLRVDLHHLAADIARVASRQGQGDVIAAGMIPHLTPRAAAAVCVVWMMRGARSPAINTLQQAFGTDPLFNSTIRILCRQVFEPAITTASNVIATSPLGPFTPIETSAPYRS